MRSAPSPYTTYVMAGSSWAASSSTYESSGAPASGCMTLGRSDCMRVPRPAARITIESGASLRTRSLHSLRAIGQIVAVQAVATRSLPCAICDLPLKCALAFELAQPFDHFQLGYGPPPPRPAPPLAPG